jgi:hypothetical protein
MVATALKAGLRLGELLALSAAPSGGACFDTPSQAVS